MYCRNPSNLSNLGTIVRSANALGLLKVYVVDERNIIPNNYKKSKELNTITCGSVKWIFIKKFKNT